MANPDIITRLKLDASQHDNGFKKSSSAVKQYANSMFDLNAAAKSALSLLPKFATAAGAVALVGDAISYNIQLAKDFEKSLSQLSSLTGVTGAELQKYKQAAIDLGGSTTQTANQVIDAFKLIGSQKPELLKNSDALKEVTKNAITLAEAAGMDVPEAAKALTASLNIMGAGANQSTRYINVLAAGSKEGAADIAALTEIIFKAGQSAKINALDFEQFITVAETIAPSFGSAQEAGTALNAMLLKLNASANDKFRPAVVGLVNALKNIKDANLSAADSTKLVTETGYKALIPLLDNIDALDKLQNKLTGTNTALEQAKTNNDNLAGSLSQLSSSWDKLMLTINSSNGIFKSMVDHTTNVLDNLNEISSRISKAQSDWDESKSKGGGFLATLKDWFKVRTDRVNQEVLQYYSDGFTGAAKVDQDVKNAAVVEESEKEIVKTYDDTTEKGITEHIKALKEERAEVKLNSAEYRNYTAQIERLQEILKKAQESRKTITRNNVGFDLTTDSIKDIKARMAEVQQIYETSGDAQGRKWAKAVLKGYQAQLDAMTGKVMGLDKLNADAEKSINGAIAENKVADTGKELKDDWTAAAKAISSVGSALQGIEDPAVKVTGILAQAVATIALSYAEAMKMAATTTGPWGWIAFGATGLATMLSSISAVKDAGKFAEGGTIGGSSFSGDRLIAHVNSGESILSRKETANAMAALDAASASTGGNVRPYVTGDMLYLGINNHLRSIGKGELVTTR